MAPAPLIGWVHCNGANPALMARPDGASKEFISVQDCPTFESKILELAFRDLKLLQEFRLWRCKPWGFLADFPLNLFIGEMTRVQEDVVQQPSDWPR